MPKILPALIAEVIGVFALVFAAIMSINHRPDIGGLLGVALAQGLTLCIMITAFGATSGGHFNPAVTIGLLVGGLIKPNSAILYILAQVLGGFLAGVAVLAIYSQVGTSTTTMTANYGAEIVRAGTTTMTKNLMGGCLAEAIATFFLVLAVWGTAADPRAPKVGGFGIGLTVTVDILAIGALTGAAMNPARAFGPALAASVGGAGGAFNGWWIYWVGPILGAILASLVYKNFIWPKNRD